jgi:hypothetical protein
VYVLDVPTVVVPRLQITPLLLVAVADKVNVLPTHNGEVPEIAEIVGAALIVTFATFDVMVGQLDAPVTSTV